LYEDRKNFRRGGTVELSRTLSRVEAIDRQEDTGLKLRIFVVNKKC
jgi:hypothetical protein